MFITSKTLFGAKFSFILMKEELQQTMTLFESNYNSQCFEGFFSEWIENTSVQISRIQNQEIILYSWVVESGQIFLAYQTYGNCLSLSCKKKYVQYFGAKIVFLQTHNMYQNPHWNQDKIKLSTLTFGAKISKGRLFSYIKTLWLTWYLAGLLFCLYCSH